MISSRRAVLCVLAIAVAAGACKKKAGGDVQLVRHAPAVGERSTATDRLDSRMQITSEPGKTTELLTTRLRTTHVEVLAVGADGIISAAKVHYDVHHDLQTRDGVAQTKTSPLEGQTYHVATGDAGLVVRRDDGSELAAPEQAEVVADVGRFVGKLPPISALLLAHRWHPGDPIDLSADELASAFGQNPMMRPVSGTGLLVGVTAGVATFEFDLTLARDDADSRAESPTRMTIKLDVAHFHPVETTLIGTLRGQVAGMDATGTLDGRIVYVYE